MCTPGATPPLSHLSGRVPPNSIKLSGGSYSSAPDDALIIPGSGLNKNDDGTYGVHQHQPKAVAAKDPSCTDAGNEAYWECSVCHQLFSDEAMTRPTTLDEVTIAATHHQNVQHVGAKDPTEAEAGNLEYWHCPDCGRYFSDEALTQQTTLEAVTLPATGEKPGQGGDQKPDEQATHTVTFVWGAGHETVVEVDDGELVTPPTDAPKIDGWTFTGSWYTTRADDGTLSGEYDFSTPLSGDLTLYAGWRRTGSGQDAAPVTPDQRPTGEQGPSDQQPAGEKPAAGEKGEALAKTFDSTSFVPAVVAGVAGVAAIGAGVAARLRGRRRE